MSKSKSKTFQKGDDYGELIDWFVRQIETHEYQPKCIASYADGLGPYDPVCEIVSKYVITVRRVESEPAKE